MEIPSTYLKTCSLLGLVLTAGLFSALVGAVSPPRAALRPVTAAHAGEADFRQGIQPLFKKYCYACHSGSVKSGGVAFDTVKSYAELQQGRKLFQRVLKNLRSGLMPPVGADRPTEADRHGIEQWIKTEVYRIDPANPDPGRVTVRRLNRFEYGNTIRDLVGIDYDTQTEFPPDDAGHGFDNIGDDHTEAVLSIFRLYRAAKMPIEVHVFTRGQHAFNMGSRSKLTTIKNWPQRLADWMGDNNLLDPAVPAKNVR